jgi:hypothetical protein
LLVTLRGIGYKLVVDDVNENPDTLDGEEF